MSIENDDDYPAPEELPYVEDVAKTLAPYWIIYIFRGILITLFGLFFLFSPDQQSLEVLANLLGGLLLIEGCIYLVQTLVACFRTTQSNSMLYIYIAGFITSFSIGFAIISYPHETAHILLICVAAWFILIGLLQLLVASIFRAAEVRGGSDLMIGGLGLLYVILGCIFLANLNGSVRLLIRILGFVVTLFGFQLVYLGLRLRYLISIADEPSVVDVYIAASVICDESRQRQSQPYVQTIGTQR